MKSSEVVVPRFNGVQRGGIAIGRKLWNY